MKKYKIDKKKKVAKYRNAIIYKKDRFINSSILWIILKYVDI